MKRKWIKLNESFNTNKGETTNKTVQTVYLMTISIEQIHCINYLRGNNAVAMLTIVADRPPVSYRMTSDLNATMRKKEREKEQAKR